MIKRLQKQKKNPAEMKTAKIEKESSRKEDINNHAKSQGWLQKNFLESRFFRYMFGNFKSLVNPYGEAR